jgi:hypothetical protein
MIEAWRSRSGARTRSKTAFKYCHIPGTSAASAAVAAAAESLGFEHFQGALL